MLTDMATIQQGQFTSQQRFHILDSFQLYTVATMHNGWTHCRDDRQNTSSSQIGHAGTPTKHPSLINIPSS